MTEDAQAIAVGIERTTVVLIESRDGRRTAPGEVLRVRQIGTVDWLAGDGVVLARRRFEAADTPTLVAELIDEVRAAVVLAPHLRVGLVQDAGDATWRLLGEGLAALAREGMIRGWCEAIDRGALRGRLERTLGVIEEDDEVREERLDYWDACLDVRDDAVAGIATFLARRRERAARPTIVDAQLRFLADQGERLRYVALRRAGLYLRGRRHVDDRPARMVRER